MDQRILIGTRKGLVTYRRKATGWVYDGLAFRGIPVSMVLQDPRDRCLYAALEHGHFGAKLHRSDDEGRSWQEITAPAFPAGDPEGRALIRIWALEAAGADMPGTIWAGTVPGGLFQSQDRGATWQLNPALDARPERKFWMGAGNDTPALHTILVHPKDSRDLLLAISTGGLWHSADVGANWENIGEGLWQDHAPPEFRENPNGQDVHRIARCRARPDRLYMQHHNAVFVSDDAGRHWREASRGFGFGVVAHPRDPEIAWFVPGEKDEYRMPVAEDFAVVKTTDGAKSFRRIKKGLPEGPGFDLVLRHALAIDETGDRLAFASTTGNFWLSEDGGESWRALSHHLPPVYVVRFIE